jgi:hypothetical protein
MAFSTITLPPTSPILPKDSILISFDCEANQSPPDQSFVPGSTLTVGAVALIKQGEQISLAPAPFHNITFHGSFAPTVMQDKNNAAFWKQHSKAHFVAVQGEVDFCAQHRDKGNLIPPHTLREAFNCGVMKQFMEWLHYLDMAFGWPIAFLSRPHSYDGAHLAYLLTQHGLWGKYPLESATWHDVKEVLLASPNGAEAYAQFKQATQNLPHIADQDALLQGLAFIRALKTLPRDTARLSKLSSTAD